MQNRPVDPERGSDFQELAWPGIAAAEVAMERGECSRLSDAMTQSHEVRNRPGWVIDSDWLALGCLDVRQPEFKG
jgi:hypothetical protein